MWFLTQADLTAHLRAAVARVPSFNAPAINPVDHRWYYRKIHKEW